MSTSVIKPNASNTGLRFGRFTLLPNEQRLVCDGAVVPLGPRAFDLLCLLVQRAGQLVTKNEMLDRVWRGLVVEEANLYVQVSLVRKAIGAEAILTVPSRGYQFILPTTVQGTIESADAIGTNPLRRLSVIVLPFVESRATREQAYFADAITDDVTTHLSKIRGSYVIGNRTALMHKNELPDLASLARELGVRYVLQGRIERLALAIETNVRLSDAMSGEVVWSDSIEVASTGWVEIRHELVARLANVLNMELINVEAGRCQRENADHPEAMDLLMQSRSAGATLWSSERYEGSLQLCQQALRLQPGFGLALAERARLLTTLALCWPGADCEAKIIQAEADIQQALAQDSLDSRSHFVLSTVCQLLFRFDAAFAAVDQALELNPSDSEALAWRGYLLLCTGEAGSAPALIHRALALSPRDPQRWVWLCWIGWSYLLVGRYSIAVPWFEKSIAVLPHWATFRQLAAALAHMGRRKEAQSVLNRLTHIASNRSDTARYLRTSNNEVFLAQHRDHVAQGLVKAGVYDALKRHDQWAARQRRIGLRSVDSDRFSGS